MAMIAEQFIGRRFGSLGTYSVRRSQFSALFVTVIWNEARALQVTKTLEFMRFSQFTAVARSLALAVLAGHVTDITTGQPLPNVTIVVGSHRTTTDVHGEYRLKGLTPGHHTLSASSKDVPLQHRSVIVKGGGNQTTVDLVLCSTHPRLQLLDLRRRRFRTRLAFEVRGRTRRLYFSAPLDTRLRRAAVHLEATCRAVPPGPRPRQ